MARIQVCETMSRAQVMSFESMSDLSDWKSDKDNQIILILLAGIR